MIRRGEIWWASLPEPVGSEPGSRRPLLIVQSDEFNRSRIATVLGVALTSKTRLAEAPGNVLLPRKATGLPSMTWSESVDQAICYGWIDGLRKSVDEKSYKIRFTPRRLNSNWSAINIKKVEALTKAGLMMPAGLHQEKIL